MLARHCQRITALIVRKDRSDKKGQILNTKKSKRLPKADDIMAPNPEMARTKTVTLSSREVLLRNQNSKQSPNFTLVQDSEKEARRKERIKYRKTPKPPKAKTRLYSQIPEFTEASLHERKSGRNPVVVLIIGIMALLAILIPLLILKFHTKQDPELSGAQQAYLRNYSHINQDNTYSYKAIKSKQITQFIKTLAVQSGRNSKSAEQVAVAIVKESLAAEYDPLKVAAVVFAESSFRVNARSNKGALGLMQIMPATGAYIAKIEKVSWKSKKDLNDPLFNVRLGVAYLKYLESMFKNNDLHVLGAYNWGPGNIQKLRQGKYRSMPKSVRKYGEKIKRMHRRWAKDYVKFRKKGILA